MMLRCRWPDSRTQIKIEFWERPVELMQEGHEENGYTPAGIVPTQSIDY